MDTQTMDQINAGAEVRRDGDGTTIVTIGGVDVHVRVNYEGKLYVWVEMDDDEAPLINRETECLPLKMGVAETLVFETDDRGLGADSGLFEPLYRVERP